MNAAGRKRYLNGVARATQRTIGGVSVPRRTYPGSRTAGGGIRRGRDAARGSAPETAPARRRRRPAFLPRFGRRPVQNGTAGHGAGAGGTGTGATAGTDGVGRSPDV